MEGKSTRKYQKAEFPNSEVNSKTILTGIRGLNNSGKIYVSGIYQSAAGVNNGFIYKGDLSGKGNWYVLNYPEAKDRRVTGTSFYGPNSGPKNKDGQETVQAVGSYTIKDSGDKTFGCLYQGTLEGAGRWTTLIPNSKEKVIGTIAHSTMGGLVVGNYSVKTIDEAKKSVILKRAFLYDIETDKYFKIKIPNSLGTTAYGIWQHDKHSYLICGGYSADIKGKIVTYGYVVEFNKSEMCFKQFKKYEYENNASVTHFNGISSDGKTGYNLTGDAITTLIGPKDPQPIQVAFFANIKEFGKDATWEVIEYPKAKTTSGNSVYLNVVVGVYVDDKGKENSYISS